MKSLLPVTLALTLLCSGCALIPKPVELFQKKVQAVPELSARGQEYQRQAADYISRHDYSTNHLSTSLSTSLGPPSSVFSGDPFSLAQKLDHQVAGKNEDLRDFAKRDDKLAGKKIEGTGLLRIPYFLFVGLVILGFMLVWTGIKAYGMVNPIVGTSAGIVGRVSATVLHTGFSELVSGGQQFLQWVEKSNLTQDMKDWITNTFVVAHQTQQSIATQNVVDKLTATPTNNTAAPTAPPKV